MRCVTAEPRHVWPGDLLAGATRRPEHVELASWLGDLPGGRWLLTQLVSLLPIISLLLLRLHNVPNAPGMITYQNNVTYEQTLTTLLWWGRNWDYYIRYYYGHRKTRFVLIGFRSRFSQCVDYMRFNEKWFCFRWQEAPKLMLFGNTKTSNLVILYDLRYLTGNISSIMTKHMGVQRELCLSHCSNYFMLLTIFFSCYSVALF